VLASPAVPAEDAASPPRSWRDGPVRYLLNEDEYRRYGRVRTPEAREAWVERFWRRLDPDPRTQENEFRERFEGRVEQTHRFREAVTPGWRTDRGRVLLLAGPPSSVRRDSNDAIAVEREIWTYGVEPTRSPRSIEVVFYRDRQGRFRLEPERYVPLERDPEQLVTIARALRYSGVSASSIRLFMQTVRDSEARARSWPADAPRPEAPQGPPPPRAVAVSTPSILRTGTWFFQAADGSVLAVFAVDAPVSGTVEPSGAAVWIWDSAEGPSGGSLRVPMTLAEDGDVGRGWRRFTGRAYVEPGTYELRFAVDDTSQGALAVHGERVDVPELGLGVLAASSVVPAERFGPAPAGKSSAYAVGSEEVVPRPGATFHRGEPLRLYFQLYGAEPDARTQRPRVDLRVRFSKVSGRPRHQGDPFVVRGASGASLGLSLPVGNWPAGEYRARIDLHDRVSGRRASTEGRFRIEE
jgi:GWxTD domain-containing protein